VIEQVWPTLGQFWIVQVAPELLQVPASVGHRFGGHAKPELEHAPGMFGH
jgi:hypothetical protein